MRDRGTWRWIRRGRIVRQRRNPQPRRELEREGVAFGCRELDVPFLERLERSRIDSRQRPRLVGLGDVLRRYVVRIRRLRNRGYGRSGGDVGSVERRHRRVERPDQHGLERRIDQFDRIAVVGSAEPRGNAS